MSIESDSLIAKAQEKIRSLEAELVKTKEFVNQIREFEGQAPLYPDVAVKLEGSLGVMRSDRFYGQPLATAVRDILEMRKAQGLGAASINEIYKTLTAGGYKFDTANEDNSKTGLRRPRKNPVFHKIPNGDYGLSDWYPKRRKLREEDGSATAGASADEVFDEEPDQTPAKPEFAKPR